MFAPRDSICSMEGIVGVDGFLIVAQECGLVLVLETYLKD
jgi:hypothetical protein